MNKQNKIYISRAVILYLDGDMDLFQKLKKLAIKEYKEEKERRRLHATVQEILESKNMEGVRIWQVEA